MPEEMHPDGHPGSHRRPRRGSELGLKGEIALLLLADAGSKQVRQRDIPAQERHDVNNKAGVLEQMALIVCHGPDADTPAPDGRPNLQPDRPGPYHCRTDPQRSR